MEMHSKQINAVFCYRLKRLFIGVLTSLIPFKSLRRKLRNSNKKPVVYHISEKYGKVYMPYVNFPNQIPEIYNKEGVKAEVFFIRDRHGVRNFNSSSSGGGAYFGIIGIFLYLFIFIAEILC